MVGASKILTVSYGTFSCTLEGFDDPFSTMRGIAEYFRDLAADDRYFGAEPPTPDAEMLHKIAEREVQRRVEAQVKDDGIVLRQLANEPDKAKAAKTATAPAAEAAEEDEDAAPAADLAETEDDDRNMFVDLDDVSDRDDEDADDDLAAEHVFGGDTRTRPGTRATHDYASVAAKLSRIRAVVSTGSAATAASAYSGSIDTAFEDIDPAAEAELDEPTITADDLDMEFGYAPNAGEVEVTSTHNMPELGADEIVEASEALYPADAEEAGEPIEAAGDAEPSEVEEESAEDAPVATSEDEMIAQTEAEDVAELEALDGATEMAADEALSNEAGQEVTEPETLETTEAEFETEVEFEAQAEAEDEPEVEAAPEAEAEAEAEFEAEPEADAEAEQVAEADEPLFEAADDYDDLVAEDEAPEFTDADDDDLSEDEAAEDEAAAEDTEIAAAETTEAPEEDDRKLGLAARIVKLKRAALEMSSKPAADEVPAAPPQTEAAVHHVVEESEAEKDPLEAADMTETELSDTAEDGFDSADEDDDWSDDMAETLSDDDWLDDDEDEDDLVSAMPEDKIDDAAMADSDDLDAVADDMADDVEDEAREDGESDTNAMLAAIAKAARAAEERAAAEEPEPEPVKKKERAITRPVFEAEEGSGEAFERILEQTNSQLDDTEGNRRRSAIAHLKAAVAATKADRLLKRRKPEEEQNAEEQSRYRDDLAKVVRPQRPVTEPREPVERPEMLKDKPAPLMLVSELRVDDKKDAATEDASVLPRRVNTDTADYGEAVEGVSTSFAEFVAEMGATELPELLEAAAAYTAFVEGRKEFSRPQLMRRVANFEQEGFTREAGLRSFGQLLRQGKIQKLKRGQFTITDDTRFNPEARLAGE